MSTFKYITQLVKTIIVVILLFFILFKTFALVDIILGACYNHFHKKIKKVIGNMNNLLFLTGAGISVDSGLPTFEGHPEYRQILTRSYVEMHPEKYRNLVRTLTTSALNAEPNIAHFAIAQTGAPVITMNVDGLHQKAGSNLVIAVHGYLPTLEEIEYEEFPIEFGGLILYGDLAPLYSKAFQQLDRLCDGGNLVIVGTSFFTGFANQFHQSAKKRNINIYIINDNASQKVPELLQNLGY